VNSVKTNGRMAIIGFPDDPVTFDPFELVVHQMSITGSFLGNRIAMREMLSFAQAHSIRPAVELMPMSRANDAIRRVRENQARYRIVLVNDMDNG
jgi:D-arabinose 1-dehydrogenase-like Zn-dependent alcohol dehydrogenase